MAIDRWTARIALRLRSLVSGTRLDRELDEELQFHIDQQTDLNINRGMNREDARRAAMGALGGVEQQKEQCRDARHVSWLLDAIRDGRHGLRLLSRTPAFAAAAILSLGLGIGANVSMFSIVDALILKKLPVPNPDGLVQFVSVMEPPYRSDSVSLETFERLQQVSTPFSVMAAAWPIERANLTVNGSATSESHELTRVVLVTGDYFATLGVHAAIGRVLTPADDTERPLAVVSDTFWKTRLGADPGALSRTLHLNGATFAIAGVMPTGFSGERVGMPADLWVPFAHGSKVMPEVPETTRAFVARLIGRIAPGLSMAQATAAMDVAYRQVRRDEMSQRGIALDEAEFAKGFIELVDASRGISPQRDAFRQSLLILLAGVALLLLVACANVANLLLARSTARQRELAVRLAVGAGRGRIARQMLTESALLASLGGLAGVAVASWANRVLTSLLAAAPVSLLGQSMGLSLDLRIDPRVFMFATALCALASMVSGMAPALAAQRITPASTLRASPTLGLGRLDGPSAILVIAQVAMSLVLLIGAGLFVATLRNLRAHDLGLERDNTLFVWTVPGQTGAQNDAMTQLWQRIIERLTTVPGVVAVGASNQAVLNGGAIGTGVPVVLMTVVGEPPKPTPLGAGRVFVTPGFFDAAGIRFVAGRDFAERDSADAPPVTILNASMAKFYFGSEAAAVGRMVQVPGPFKEPHQVVGVVRDFVRTTPRHQSDSFSNFFSYRHPEARNRGQQLSRLRVMLIAIKSAGDPLTLAESVRAEIRAIDPLLPILRINTTAQQLDDVLSQDRLVASLSTALGATAMILATLGMFGLLSYRVARRTNEIGVRLAFGATRRSVLGMVVAESGRLVLAGMMAGVVAAVMLSRLVATRLYGVSATDPWTIGGAALLLAIVACLAALIPARQAASVDPSTALRCD